MPTRFSRQAGPDTNNKWRAWEPAPGPPQIAYLEIYNLLVKLPDSKREQALEQMRRGATYTDRRQHRCLTGANCVSWPKGIWWRSARTR